MTVCRPLHNKVVVRLIDTDTVSEGGIVLASSAVEKPNKGVVVAIGPGKHVNGEFIPTILKEGDKVLFARGLGTVIKLNDEKLTMLSEDDIMAKLG